MTTCNPGLTNNILQQHRSTYQVRFELSTKHGALQRVRWRVAILLEHTTSMRPTRGPHMSVTRRQAGRHAATGDTNARSFPLRVCDPSPSPSIPFPLPLPTSHRRFDSGQLGFTRDSREESSPARVSREMAQAVEEWYRQMPIITRSYLTAAVVTTVGCTLEVSLSLSLPARPSLHDSTLSSIWCLFECLRWWPNALLASQIISPYHLYLNPKLVVQHYEIWRLVTNFLYFRKMGMRLLPFSYTCKIVSLQTVSTYIYYLCGSQS